MSRAQARVGLWLGVLAMASVACAGQDHGLYPPRSGEPTRLVWVVGHAWHTGLVIRRADIPGDLWPEQEDFAGAEYLEIGWGDRVFYQATEPTLGLALRAAIGANPSVLHVVGFTGPVEAYYLGSAIVAIGLSTRGMAALAASIHVSKARKKPIASSMPLP